MLKRLNYKAFSFIQTARAYRATALGVFNTTSQLAGAIGPSLGGLFVVYYPFLAFPRYIFYASILVAIPSILLFATFVKETLKTNPESNRQEE